MIHRPYYLTNTNIVISVGEFHVDLFTLPDSLIKMLWEFAQDRGAL